VVAASVVIPTRDRHTLLLELLRRLEEQDAAPGAFEIVVVDAGSTDSTTSMLSSWFSRQPFRWVAIGPAAAARARNAGAAASVGQLLIFLDDDMLPGPGFISAHLEAAGKSLDAVVVGACPVVGARRPFSRMIARWYTGQFDAMTAAATTGLPLTAFQVFTGNLMVPRAVFEGIGGFDERFEGYGGEDTDFGIRLVTAGIPLRYAPSAVAEHRFGASWPVWINRVRALAAGTILLAEKHPRWAREFPAGQAEPSSVLRRHGAWLAWKAPWLGLLVVPPLLALGILLDAANLDRSWQRVNRVVYDFQYWSGVRDRVGDEAGWQRVRALAQVA
jgi:GT2 family glycosyltransferase